MPIHEPTDEKLSSSVTESEDEPKQDDGANDDDGQTITSCESSPPQELEDDYLKDCDFHANASSEANELSEKKLNTKIEEICDKIKMSKQSSKDNDNNKLCSELCTEKDTAKNSGTNLNDIQFLSKVNLLKRDAQHLNEAQTNVNSSSDDKGQSQTKDSVSINSISVDGAPVVKKRRRWRRAIYDKSLDPESIKQQRKKRAVELKLKNLRWTLNQPGVSEDTTGKRKKKAPERFELALLNKRRNAVDEFEGDGDLLGDIPWIVQQVKVANIYILRLLHRVIFRRQGMFSEKHIRKSVLNFRGFPFDINSAELKKRKYPLEKASPTSLYKLSDLLGVKNGEKEVMIENILTFLQHPTRQQVEEHIKEVMMAKLQQQKQNSIVNKIPAPLKIPSPNAMAAYSPNSMNTDSCNSFNASPPSSSLLYEADECIITGPWEKPQFFVEGTGIKLKFIKPIVTALQIVADSLIELLHRILFLNGDEKSHMRRNILEFSGFRCIVGSDDYILRTKLLSVLPLDQLKFICRVLGLPTWHRSRQLLIETIMDFLAAPRLSAMKKRGEDFIEDSNECFYYNIGMTPPYMTQLSTPALTATELKPLETEEIEIVPDIHISDEDADISPKESSLEKLDGGEIRLKHFQNIHFQVMSTPAGKLSDLHMILFLKPCPLGVVRRNILDFTHFTFDEQSSDYQCRMALMNHMFLENLQRIASILCLKEYIVDENRDNIIQAVLRFLLKPSVLFQASTIGCTSPILKDISPSKDEADGNIGKTSDNSNEKNKDISSICAIVKQENFSDEEQSAKTEIVAQKNAKSVFPNILESSAIPQIVKNELPIPSPPKKLPTRRKNTPKKAVLPVIVDVKHSGMEDIPKGPKKGDLDEPLSIVKKQFGISSYDTCLDSDEDDLPLSNFIGHPNDDQLKILISKVMRESKLEELTMKQVLKIVFGAYPHFDLSYRKDFIKSVVRQILSQMDQPSGSVSTTVFTS